MRKHLLLLTAPLVLAACTGDLTGDGEVPAEQPVVEETVTPPAAPTDTLQDPGITVSQPALEGEFYSPITVRGEARASWFNGNTFPVRLKNDAGNILVDTYATALTEVSADGMTAFETFVDFSGVDAESALLVLEKGVPSEDPSAAGSVIIPVRLVR